MKKDSKSGLKVSLEQLDKALDRIEDDLSRASIPFVILGQTLRSIAMDDQVKGEKIELGIMERYLTDSCLGILKDRQPDLIREKGKIKLEIESVPVEIRVIRKRWSVLDNPNFLFYKVSEYRIPNPLERYWKVQGLIK